MANFTPMGVQAVVEGLGKFQSDLKTMESSTQGTGSALRGLGTAALGVASSIAAVGIAAAAAAVAGGVWVTNLGIQEALTAEKVNARLAATLRAVGDTTSFTAADLEDLAMQYRDLAGGSDEAVKEAETVLLRFSQLRGEAFEPALQITLDLAAALGTDAATAAGMLGRALEVPGEGLRALKAAGIVLTDEQQKMIDTMVEAGDVAGAQKFLMDALAGTIGGTASAAAATMSGQFEVLKGHLLEAAEGIGNQLLPFLGQLFDQYIKPNIPVIEELARQFGAGLAAALPVLISTIQILIQAFSNLMATLGVVTPSAGAFQSIVQGAVGVITTAVQVLTLMVVGLQQVVIFIQNAITSVNNFITTWRNNWNMALTIVTTVFARIKTAIFSFVASIKAKFDQLRKSITGAIPDWLIPGSPTDFEIGLRGVRKEATRMAATVSMQLAPVPVAPSPMRAGAAAGAGGNTIIFSPTISRDVDGMALLENFKDAARRM